MTGTNTTMKLNKIVVIFRARVLLGVVICLSGVHSVKSSSFKVVVTTVGENVAAELPIGMQGCAK